MPSNHRAPTHTLLTFAVCLPGSHLSHLGADVFSESCPECCTSYTIFSCGLNTPQSAFPVQNPPLKSRPQWQLPPWYLQPLSSAHRSNDGLPTPKGQRDSLTLVPYIWTCGGFLSSLPSHLDRHARSVIGGHHPAPAHSLLSEHTHVLCHFLTCASCFQRCPTMAPIGLHLPPPSQSSQVPRCVQDKKQTSQGSSRPVGS